MGQFPDDELVRRALSGDQAAWRDLAERHQCSLRRSIRRLCRCDADADNVVQATFLKAYLERNTLKNPTAVGGWLFRIARNEALAFYRRKRGRSFGDGEEPDLESVSDNPLSEALRRERIQAARDCVDNLPPDQRAAIELKMDHAMTLIEIADAVGIPFGTAKGRHRLGLEKLRDCLESKGYGNQS